METKFKVPVLLRVVLIVFGCILFVIATEGRIVRKSRSSDEDYNDDESEDYENEASYKINNTGGASTLESDDDDDMVSKEAGAIVGVIFGCLFAFVLTAVAGVLYVRRRRQRNEEYNRAAKAAMSARNAGVYRETTTEQKLVPSEPSGNPAYKSLVPRSDIYENESDEELFFR